MTRSQEFIWKNRKLLEDGSDFFNPDTSMMTVEDYKKAKLRFLLVFPSPHIVKTVSSTAAAINDFVIAHCKDCFIDFAYMPSGSDIKRYDDAKMPYAIGNVTHLDASHFDYVGFSISVLSEIVTAPVMLKSFERCDKPIPLFWSQRKNMSIHDCPIVYCGGITAACGDIMFGEVGKEQAYLDYQYLGSVDKTDILFKRLIEAKETGYVTRDIHDNDKPGYTHKDPENFETKLKVDTVQDYIESLFDLDMVYQPQAYRVRFNKHNQIIENTKINPKARDFVTPYYPHELLPDLGIGRTIIPANGDNTGTAQTQVSEGCSASGACSFCAEGNYCGGWVEKDKEQILKEMWECKKYSAAYKYKPYSFNCVAKGTLVPTPDGLRYVEHLKDQEILSVTDWSKHKGIQTSIQPTLDINMSQGPGLRLTPHHRQTVVTSEGLCEIRADELEPGMWVPQRINYYEPAERLDISSINYLLGLWYGDGFYGGNSTYVLVDQNDYELNKIVTCHEHCQRLVRTEGTLNVYLLSKEFTTYCRSVCPDKDQFKPYTSLNLQQVLEFIRGLFDADGCGSGGFLKITQKESRLQLLKELQVTLMSVGIRTRLSSPTKVTLNGVEHTRRDVYVVGRESRDKFVSIIGASEIRKIQDVKVESTKWSDKDKCIPPLFGVWVYNELKKINAHKGHNVSKFFHGIKGLTVDRFLELFSSYDIEPVTLVKSGIRFAQITSIEDAGECEVIDVTETTNGRWIANGYVTHNTNYITDYKGMLEKFIQIYPKVTFINMRLEELGRDTDALVMMKAIGSNRISAPIEGMSPRIQNNLLNKCLSQEAMDNFMNDLIHLKMTDIKVGGIFTCYEEDEDFQWICDYVHALKVKAKDEGGNIPFRLKCTPLVHYPLTPLEYLERKSAKNSLQGKRWLTDYWYEKFKENEIYFKVNGFRYSTFLEQSLVDLGRSITFMIHKHFVEPLAPIYSLRSVATDEFLEELKNFIDQDTFFETRDPAHYISIAHRIHIDLMGSYIPRARRLVRAYQSGNVFSNQPDIRCLKTYDGAKTMCQHNCIIKDPLKIYTDVTMDENGELHGPYTLLNGCERCETPELRLRRLKRPTPQTKNSDDIIAVPRIPIRQRIRFVIRRNKDYDVLNPNNTAHTFMTKFLQLSDNLLHKYHSIVNHNMFWNADPGLPYFVSGFQVVDTFWQDDVIAEVQSLIPEVNKMLTSVQVISAKEELREEKIDVNDVNIWYFESELPAEMFSASARMYDGEVKVMGGGMMAAIETIIDKDLKAPIFATKGKTLGYFALPCKYNPVLFLSSFLKAKKTSPAQVVASTTIECAMTMREATAVCKHCGNERVMVSVTTGKQLPFGQECICKALLSQRLKA